MTIYLNGKKGKILHPTRAPYIKVVLVVEVNFCFSVVVAIKTRKITTNAEDYVRRREIDTFDLCPTSQHKCNYQS